MIKEYSLSLDSNLNQCYKLFRSETSKIYTHKEQDYPVVYLSNRDFAKLTIEHNSESKITLIVNLQNYYVFGFLIDGKCYSYKDLDGKLTEAGFSVDEIIPYGDAYYQIGDNGIEEKVCEEQVTVESIVSSLEYIVDTNNSWIDKKPHLLRVFWSLIEGIRFSGISNVVQDLFNDKKVTETFRYFFYMAERWEKISIGNAFMGKIDDSIAVYDLRPLEYIYKN